MAFAIGGTLVCGAGLATQSRINGELSLQLGDGVLAALISFAIGFVIVIAALLFLPGGRRGIGVVARGLRDRSIPWLYVLGGVCGAYLVFTQGMVAAVLGVALFSIAVVAGQTLSGTLIDRRGIGTMAPKPVTSLRVVGALLALGAVIFAGSTQLDGDFAGWMLALPFLGGIGIAWQQAVNGQVREVSGSAATATFINFLVGTTVLLIATLVHSAWAGWPPALPADPVLYLGGVVGVVFIAGAAIIVPITGVLLLSLGMIAGQLLTSVLLDLVVPAAGHPLTVQTVVGTALTFVAVALVAISTRATQSTER
jgi:transporter family-2 protein